MLAKTLRVILGSKITTTIDKLILLNYKELCSLARMKLMPIVDHISVSSCKENVNKR